jgi:hypothetical protein
VTSSRSPKRGPEAVRSAIERAVAHGADDVERGRPGRGGRRPLVYAEFDDNPIYLLSPETWTSRSGAPWPYLHEYEMGCTWEHAGYHLSWMCAIFGPVRRSRRFPNTRCPTRPTCRSTRPTRRTSRSRARLRERRGGAAHLLHRGAGRPPDADHRQPAARSRPTPTATTRRRAARAFVPFTLKARNSASLRRHSILGALFGVGGRKVPLVTPADRAFGALGTRSGERARRAWLKRLPPR